MSLEVTKQELLKQAIYLNKLYATTRNQEYKDQESRLRRIVVELDTLSLGGASDLNGLTDVTISAPANAQVLAYNSTTSQWQNQTPIVPTLNQVTTAGNVTTNTIEVREYYAVPTTGAQFKVTSGYAAGTPLMGLSYVKFSGFLSGTVGSIMFFDQSGYFSITGYPRSDWDSNLLGSGSGQTMLQFNIGTNTSSWTLPVEFGNSMIVNKQVTTYENIEQGAFFAVARDLKHTISCNTASSTTFGAFIELYKMKNSLAITNDLIGGIRWQGDDNIGPVDAADIRVFGLSATWATAANRSSYMTFRTRNADSYGERMRITNDGNLLIGTTTNGTFKMDVNGRVRIQNMLTLGNLTADPSGTNGMIYYNTTTNKFRGYENGAWVNLI